MTTRLDAIAHLRHRFARDGYPRLTMLVILTLAGAVAFLASAGALRAGVASMAVRYGFAVLTGYAAFLFLIRGWIALHRGEWGLGFHLLDAADLAEGSPTEALDPLPALERSRDAAGYAARVASRREDSSVIARMLDSSTVDLDELGLVLVVIIGAIGAVFAVFYVIYAAPLLLAEVAFDAALVSALYRRLRHEDVGHWTGAVVRHTWIPTLSLFICTTATGFALQRIVPTAHSIGGVIHAFVN